MTQAAQDLDLTKVDAHTFEWQGERKSIPAARGWELLARYREAADALHAAKKRAKDIEREIMIEMGGFEHLAIEGQDFFHWPWVDSTSFDQKQLKTDHPDIHEKYVVKKPNGTRRFRVEGTVGVD